MGKITPRDARLKRHVRVRARVKGVESRPRLAVFRSLNSIYAQLIDDTKGHTVAAASSQEAEVKEAKVKKIAEAQLVGKLIAQRAKDKGIEAIVFDRGGYRYHGRVKALGDAAREAGLKF